MVRRNHFPLKPFQASTIHKCIGDDVPNLATQIASTDPEERNMFKLWEKNQLLVLVSRVKQLQNLTFVGPRNLTLNTIKKICCNVTQWDYYINEFVLALCSAPVSGIMNFPLNQNVYSISRQTIPDDSCATVFCLLSMKDGSFITGHCTNLKSVLIKYNTFSDTVHCLHLTKKPWAVLCAAFEPSADTITSSTLALHSKWLSAVTFNVGMLPREMSQLLRDVTESQTSFFENINFASFIN